MRVCAQIPGQPHHIIDTGLDMTGKVPTAEYVVSHDESRLAVVNLQVFYADGRRDKLDLRNQLVPAYALRKREDPDQPGSAEPGNVRP